MRKKIINYLQREGITSEVQLAQHIKKLRELPQRKVHQTQELFDLVWAVHNKKEELDEIFKETDKMDKYFFDGEYWTVDVTLPVQLFYNDQLKKLAQILGDEQVDDNWENIQKLIKEGAKAREENKIELCSEEDFLKRVRDKSKSWEELESHLRRIKKEQDKDSSSQEELKTTGIKETEGKLDHSEINLNILDLMAERFMANKHKYPKGNSKKEIAVEGLVQAMFRHIKKMIKPPLDDEETFEDHLAAVLCGGSMVLDQLERNRK